MAEPNRRVPVNDGLTGWCCGWCTGAGVAARGTSADRGTAFTRPAGPSQSPIPALTHPVCSTNFTSIRCRRRRLAAPGPGSSSFAAQLENADVVCLDCSGVTDRHHVEPKAGVDLLVIECGTSAKMPLKSCQSARWRW
jgi:hypothetical protein